LCRIGLTWKHQWDARNVIGSWSQRTVLISVNSCNFFLILLCVLPVIHPVEVAEIQPGGPSEYAGMRAGDTVEAVDGIAVKGKSVRALNRKRWILPRILVFFTEGNYRRICFDVSITT
jgi:membrane-associated protease RseP (regulator of RpoE activity)